MSQNQNKVLKRRIARAYISSVVSISLVLFIVGVAALLSVNASSVANYFRENVRVTVILKQGVSENQAKALQSEYNKMNFVRGTRYVGIDEGTRELSEMLGEDFVNVFTTSPVPTSIEVTLNPEYVHQDSLSRVSSRLGESSFVEEVSCQQSLVESLNASIGKISAVLLVFTLILLFISVVLISNTVRLVIYSNRFTIHTMQLVGATTRYIVKPYLVKAFFQGVFSSIIAAAVLVAALFALRSSFAQLFNMLNPLMLLEVLGIVFATGIIICAASTCWLVVKFINTPKNELYG